MKQLSILTLSILLCFSVSAQKWAEMMQDPNINFYDVQKEFNEYYKDKAYVKGNGWKQYKRWEHKMEPRVYPTGERPDPSLVWREMEKYKQSHDIYGKAAAGNWQQMGPQSWINTTGWNPGIGRVNGITVNPANSNTIYVGTPAGGCWKSTDDGNSWVPLTDDQPVLGVSSIVIDYTDTNTVYIATGDGDGADTYSIGVLKSTDGGANFSTTGLSWTIGQSRRIWKLLMHPTNNSIMYAATSNGIYKTTDAAANWNQVYAGSYYDIEMKPGDPTTLYISSDEFFKSTNSGNTWTQIFSGLPTAAEANRAQIAVSADEPNWVYYLCGEQSGGEFHGIYRSTNSGNSFSLRTDTPNMFGYSSTGNDNSGQSWYDMALAVDPTDASDVYIAGINVWKSTNGGASFVNQSYWVEPNNVGYTHADVHYLEVVGNAVYCGSDGGIFRSTNGGNDWTDLTEGLHINQFYRISNSATNPNFVIGGSQDNGTNFYDGNQWYHVLGADGMEAIIDYTDTDIMYGCTQSGGLRKTTDGGANWNGIKNNINEGGAWVTPYVIHPTDHNTLYAGYNNLWETNNGGNSWTAISNLGFGTIRALEISKSDPDYIYLAKSGEVWRTKNGGNSWTDITAGLPNNTVTYIAIHPDNPEKIWVTISGSNSGNKVYTSSNAGNTWSNYSGTLPNIPANCITMQDSTDNLLYVGMEVGVYYRDSTMNDWQPFMDNLPNVIVDELEIQYTAGVIRAATHGRGLWESPTLVPTTKGPTAQFTSSGTTICEGETVSYTDQSLNGATTWNWDFPGGTPASSTQQNPVVTYNSSGVYDAKLVASNNDGSDSVEFISYVTVVAVTATTAPTAEGFQNGFLPTNWTLENPGNNTTWEHNTTVGGFGLSTESIEFDNLSNDLQGESDIFAIEATDFSNTFDAVLHFDVAYARYSANWMDTLAVYYSLDCGKTRIKIYEKTNTQLATAPDHTNKFVPLDNEWRTDTVDISALYGEPWVRFYFENRNGWANFLYLDNINLQGENLWPVGIEESNSGIVSVYPNPSNGEFIFTFTAKAEMERPIITIYDLTGKIVKRIALNSQQTKVDLSGYANGMYHYEVSSNGMNISNGKLVKY